MGAEPPLLFLGQHIGEHISLGLGNISSLYARAYF